MDVEPLEIDQETEDRLHRTDGQQCNVVTPLPEAPAKPRDDGARDDGDQHEAEDVVAIRHVIAADRLCGEEVAAQPDGEQEDTEPRSHTAVHSADGKCVGRSHNSLRITSRTRARLQPAAASLL